MGNALRSQSEKANIAATPSTRGQSPRSIFIQSTATRDLTMFSTFRSLYERVSTRRKCAAVVASGAGLRRAEGDPLAPRFTAARNAPADHEAVGERLAQRPVAAGKRQARVVERVARAQHL